MTYVTCTKDANGLLHMERFEDIDRLANWIVTLNLEPIFGRCARSEQPRMTHVVIEHLNGDLLTQEEREHIARWKKLTNAEVLA